MSGPHHLAKFDTHTDNNFSSETVYRRCPFGNREAPFVLTQMFLDIRWEEDLMKGLSVNRNKYSKPEDALWSPINEDVQRKECEYVEKKGIVYGSHTDKYEVTDPKTGATFTLAHTPINCNIAHCDIF